MVVFSFHRPPFPNPTLQDSTQVVDLSSLMRIYFHIPLIAPLYDFKKTKIAPLYEFVAYSRSFSLNAIIGTTK